MILKKPYAFLIKHFQLIHVILTAISAYVIYKTTPIVTFFRAYVANDYSLSSAFQNLDLVSNVVLILVFVLVLLIVVLIFLFSYKNKKKTFYILYLFYYIALFITLFLANNIIHNLGKSTVAPDIARIYQDAALIIYLPQLLFVILCGVRALGFNVKQFNFSKDYKDLSVEENDNEEVELSLGLETYKTKRSIRRFIREFKYYIKENAFMLAIILLISIGLIIYLIIASRKDFTTYYKMGEIINYNNLEISVDDTIITNLTAGGNIIADNKYYLLLKLNVKNNTSKDQKIDFNDIRICYGSSKYLTVSYNVDALFVDYGQSISNSVIAAGKNVVYALAYEIDPKIFNNDLSVKIYTGVTYKANIGYITNGIVKIKPIIVDKVNLIGAVGINGVLNTSGSYLLNTVLTINDYQITDRYLFTYKSCISKDNCSEYKDIVSRNSAKETLLVLVGNLVLDNSSVYAKNISAAAKFPDYFLKVQYTIGGNNYIAPIVNATPKNYSQGYIFRTNSDLLNAETLSLLVTVRNKQYSIALKS